MDLKVNYHYDFTCTVLFVKEQKIDTYNTKYKNIATKIYAIKCKI